MKALVSLFVAVFLLSPVGASAKQIAVRAGEHPNFSRLVFEFDNKPEWRIQKTKGGYILEFGTKNAEFDFSAVFRFIPRTRIRSLSHKSTNFGQAAFIETDCDCHPNVFSLRRGGIVLDIADGAADAETPKPESEKSHVHPASAESDKNHDSNSKLQIIAPEPSRLQTNVLTPPQLVPERTASVSLGGFVDATPQHITQAKDTPVNGGHGMQPGEGVEGTTSHAQNELIQQLGRAASQGLILFKTPPQNLAPDLASVLLSVPEAERQSADTDGIEKTTTNMGIHDGGKDKRIGPVRAKKIVKNESLQVRTAVDRKAMDDPRDDDQTMLSKYCAPQASINVANWGGDQSFHDQVSELRLALVQEFDQVDVAALERLTKLYIHFGFGAEAISLLGNFDAEIADEPILLDLARVMEFGEGAPAGALAQQRGCAGAALFWSTLSDHPDRYLERVAHEDITHHFSLLPIRLRRLVGPAIGARLLDAGRLNVALEIRDLIKRAPGEHGSDFALFSAQLDLQDNMVFKARDALIELVKMNAPNADEALVLLMNSFLEENQNVPSPFIEEASARAFVSRRSPVGQELKILEIRSLAKSGKADAAFVALKSVLGATEPKHDLGQSLISEIFEDLAATEADGGTFSKIFFVNKHLLDNSDQMDEARTKLAERFLAIGLPQVAHEIITPVLLRADADDRELIAETLIESMPPSDAQRTIAAKFMASDVGEAVAEDTVTENYASIDEEPLSPFLEAMDLPEAPTLVATKDILVASRNSRNILNELLADNQVPAMK